MFEKFSADARQAVLISFKEASSVSHTAVDTTHLLLGMTHPGDGSVCDVLAEAGITREAARARVLELVGSGPTPANAHLPFTENAKVALTVALYDSRARGEEKVCSENLLRAILAEDGSTTAKVVADVAGPNLATLLERIGTPLGGDGASD